MAALATLANGKTTLPKYNTPGSAGSGNRNYAFPDWPDDSRYQATAGTWSASVPVSRGTVYRDSNFAYQLCTTAGVTKSGAHPVWATVVGATTVDNTVVWTLITLPRWLTELNRLRGNLNSLVFPFVESNVSGPWPVTGYTNTFQANVANCIFYYPDNGIAQSVTISAACLDFYFDEYISDVLAGSYFNTYSSFTSQIVVGGDKTISLTGELDLTIDETGGPVSIVVTSTLPGTNFVFFTSGGGQTVYQSIWTAQAVTPGTYTIQIVITNGTSHYPFLGFTLGGSPLVHQMTVSYTETASAAAAAIHGTLPVRKIICPQGAPGVFPYGIWGQIVNEPFTTRQVIYTATAPNGWIIFWTSSPPILTATCNGFFTANTPAISNLNTANPPQMPWNLQQTKAITGGGGATFQEIPMLLGNLDPGSLGASNSYVNTTVVEQQSEPPVWQGSTWFSLGFTILDSNGNFQKVSTAGRSGVGAPVWATSGITADGATLRWTFEMTPSPSLFPAVHRPLSVPRYPFYWYSETIARLKPPTTTAETEKTIWGCGNQWNQWHVGNHALGWFIYSVSLNRIGSHVVGGAIIRTQDAAGNPQEVAVTVGCMRSGVFVAFGTYNTGQTIQVLWPIFTTDALVYQCAERVDIQAVAIASGGIGVTRGVSAAGYPVCAAFVSDVTALLGLIA